MSRRRESPEWTFFLVGVVLVVVVTGALRLGLKLAWLPAAVIRVSVATFVLYGFDKRRAGTRRGRVPEVILHLFALAGGSPGALLGQQLFRHKTRKVAFQVVFWLIVVLQVGLILYVWWTRR
jgi:uncharacterized membrane protein YsdA (DUF1294 family)